MSKCAKCITIGWYKQYYIYLFIDFYLYIHEIFIYYVYYIIYVYTYTLFVGMIRNIHTVAWNWNIYVYFIQHFKIILLPNRSLWRTFKLCLNTTLSLKAGVGLRLLPILLPLTDLSLGPSLHTWMCTLDLLQAPYSHLQWYAI